MKCDWKPTGEYDERGRERLECRRLGCNGYGWETKGRRIADNQCDGIAEPWLIGTWLDAWLRVFWITKPRVKAVLGECGCEKRQSDCDALGKSLAGAGGEG